LCTHGDTHMALKALNLDATETARVGIRKFRENFSTFLGSFDKPVAITRHGDTIGYYIPARPRRSENEKAALTQAVSRFHEVLAAKGISPEEMIEDFKKSQVDQRKEVLQSARAEQGA
jgi:hypothetical protein